MNAEEVKQEVLSWLDNAPADYEPENWQKGVVTGLMNTALRLNSKIFFANIRRRQVLAWLFRDKLEKPMRGEISAKELTNEMWYALINFAEIYKDGDEGAWKAHEGFENEMLVCLKAIENWEHDMNNQFGFAEDL